MTKILQLANVSKSFTMHLQGGIRLPVVNGATFHVHPGECVVLAGPSGTGKSSLLKMIFGSYRCDKGQILLRHDSQVTDIASAGPRGVLALRRKSVGYVSQFLRAVPRVPTIDIVAGPLEADGIMPAVACAKAGEMLSRLNLPDRLWQLPPATFSGGEQQRVNIARGLLPERPLLLLDEPTASLDAVNRAIVVDLIQQKKKQGAGIVAIVHDDDVRAAIADTLVDVTAFSKAA
ncbi:phosphonate C-P lyase system protein PhnL [Pseudorhodoplanes sinuspersici]|uniref:Phosphonate C-P lyase system protein PhnL n=1 Tax=Pseudorhodoplanes sinuspersici TaxID=1235591 RepID=A0A1W6ZYV2_9HYPH|nr:phosphonate C-P lyase system protein PhnL [Pseudorhodoplanes sinuspersici]ARQ02503.1 phosphonate C-P lyase system protein PhnL [Pseudorhodoplanes sinuspersici]RKE74343.1 alpha-D-ribose 1-methylphosphonate 5-triphosphate synthase subunit PhnL [Pseudorhodoplanes sinuspersici]